MTHDRIPLGDQIFDQAAAHAHQIRGGQPRLTFLEAAALDERDQLDARAACAEQERDEARDDRDQARADAAEWTARAHRLDRMCTDLQRALDGQQANNRSLRRANTELTAANARLRQQLGGHLDALSVIRDSLERIDRAMAAVDTGGDQTTPPVDIRDGSLHVGRAFTGTEIEDLCPCRKAPCGLVVQGAADPACQHHPTAQARTMRQIHHADQCPVSEPTEDLRSPLAAERDSLVETIGRLVSLPPDDIARMHKVGYTGTSTTAPVPSAPVQESHTVAQEQHNRSHEIAARRWRHETAHNPVGLVLGSTAQPDHQASPAQDTDPLADRLAGVVADMLSRFRINGHPGEQSQRTGWVPNRSITAWRAVYAEWADRAVTDEQAEG